MPTISCYFSRINCNEKSAETTKFGILSLVTVNDSPAIYLFEKSFEAVQRVLPQQNIPQDIAVLGSAFLVDIVYFQIKPTLTVLNNKAAAVCLVSIITDSGKFPEIWFDDIDGIIPSQTDIYKTLGKWLNPFKLDLVGDGNDRYFLANLASRWPSELPQPSQDSAIQRFGQLGLGIVNTFLGSPVKNVRWFLTFY
jgi:hypothetical protein